MIWSFSRVGTFENCPFQFKLRYVDGLTTYPAQNADNALIVGHALHTGLERGRDAMLTEYANAYYCLTDAHIHEMIKLDLALEKIADVLPATAYQYERQVKTAYFTGFIDLITDNGDGSYNLYDFKYSNNIDKYMDSAQIHIYKYFLEKTGMPVREMGYIFAPKTMIRQKKTETLFEFRRRLAQTFASLTARIVTVPYDAGRVAAFFESCLSIDTCTAYPKNESRLCDYCEFKSYCKEGDIFMLLPKNERRAAKQLTTPDMWLYGDSYSGKTVFIDGFPNVLMLNTDGNVDHTTAPVMRIKDEVTTEGRITKRVLAWEVFKDAVLELEKKDNDFSIIAVDLVEDVFEHCRLYMYERHGWEHEQDAGFGKGWDMVRTEFLSTMKRLKNAGYQLVLISKAATGEITSRSGEKITTIKPNVNDKIANVLAGIVDLTARVVADGNDRYLSFKTSPYIFGGGRLNFEGEKIPLNYTAFMDALKSAQTGETQDRRKARKGSNE